MRLGAGGVGVYKLGGRVFPGSRCVLRVSLCLVSSSNAGSVVSSVLRSDVRRGLLEVAIFAAVFFHGHYGYTLSVPWSLVDTC